MISRSLVAVSGLLALLGLALFAGPAPRADDAPPAAVSQAVVIELFTSEGCSSCPPADDLLRELEDAQPLDGVEILALSQHVDYWDSLGWKDPFSSAHATKRQYRYAAREGSGRVYTPQMIVDGGEPFVGSQRRQLLNALGRAARAPKAALTWVDGEQAPWIRVDRLPEGIAQADVYVAVTETGLGGENAIPRGENRGRKLKHPSVVRRLERVGRIDGSGDLPLVSSFPFQLDPAWNRSDVRLVAFVQEPSLGTIHGAAVLSLE